MYLHANMEGFRAFYGKVKKKTKKTNHIHILKKATTKSSLLAVSVTGRLLCMPDAVC